MRSKELNLIISAKGVIVAEKNNAYKQVEEVKLKKDIYSFDEICSWIDEDPKVKEHYLAVKKELLKSVSIPKRLKKCSFDNFDDYTDNLKKIVKHLKGYSKELTFCNTSNSVFMFGEVGNGKTHLAVSIIKELIKKEAIKNTVKHKIAEDLKLANDENVIRVVGDEWGYHIAGTTEIKGARQVEFMQGPELFQELKNSFNDKNKDTGKILGKYKKADVLVWDDILTAKKTDWVLEQIHSIISYRYKEELPIIFTSNLSVEAFNSLASNDDDYRGKRIFSRIVDMCQGNLFKFDNKDYTLAGVKNDN